MIGDWRHVRDVTLHHARFFFVRMYVAASTGLMLMLMLVCLRAAAAALLSTVWNLALPLWPGSRVALKAGVLYQE